MATKKSKSATPQRLLIPELGTHIVLAEKWAVELHKEYRNDKFIETHGKNVEFPVGTTLIFDRIYIRAGAKDFSSITFRCSDKLFSGRFWVKLADANRIMFTMANASKQVFRVTDTGGTYDKRELARRANVVEAASRSALAKKLVEGRFYVSAPNMFEMLAPRIIPELLKEGKWVQSGTSDTYRQWDFEPVDKNPYMKKRGRSTGYGWGAQYKTVTEDYYDNYEARADFTKDFWRKAKEITGAKNQTELLDHLPSRYRYEEIEEIV